MPQADFFWFLAKSMDALKNESLPSYLRLSKVLEGLRASISAGVKKRLVYFDNGQFFVTSDAEGPNLEIVFRDNAVIDLIDGKYSLEQAVLAEAIFVKGSVATLEKFHSALNLYLNGALRAPSFPRLLSRYRRTIGEQTCETDR
jgi:hypothetical protein